MGLLSGQGPAAYKSVDRTNFTATAGQTTFTVSQGYYVGDVEVYLNGIKLVDVEDYTAINGSTINLSSGAAVGDVLQVVSYNQFVVSNTYTKSESDTKYMVSSGINPMTSYLRTPNYGVSSWSDSSSASLEASVGSGEQGVGVKAIGRSVATNGGDILYTSDTRGAGGRHRFGYWNGTNFTQSMYIDNSGRVLMPQQPFVNGYPTGANVTTATKAVLNSNYSQNCLFSNSRFTCQVDGLYECVLNTTINNNANENDVWVYKNGSPISPQLSSWSSANSTWTNMHLQNIIKCSANDYLEFYWRGYTYGSSSWNYFHFRLVG